MRAAKNSTEVLKAAKWMLENIGWVQGRAILVQDNKPVGLCLTGALSYTNASGSDKSKAYQRLRDALPKKAEGQIVYFNDHHKTTKKMVLNVIDRAIKKGAK